MRLKKDVNIKIGTNIQAARERAGYTQERLSEILNLSPNHLSAIERGVSSVSLDALRKICRLFGISADYILFGENKPDDTIESIAYKLSMVKPEYQPQVNKVVSALLEMSVVMENEQAHKE